MYIRIVTRLYRYELVMPVVDETWNYQVVKLTLVAFLCICYHVMHVSDRSWACRVVQLILAGSLMPAIYTPYRILFFYICNIILVLLHAYIYGWPVLGFYTTASVDGRVSFRSGSAVN